MGDRMVKVVQPVGKWFSRYVYQHPHGVGINVRGKPARNVMMAKAGTVVCGYRAMEHPVARLPKGVKMGDL